VQVTLAAWCDPDIRVPSVTVVVRRIRRFALRRFAGLDTHCLLPIAYQSDLYDQLGAIAPTVAIDGFGQPLVDALMQFGDLLGKTAEATELRDSYNSDVTDEGIPR
jgi:hypothetical protein